MESTGDGADVSEDNNRDLTEQGGDKLLCEYTGDLSCTSRFFVMGLSSGLGELLGDDGSLEVVVVGGVQMNLNFSFFFELNDNLTFTGHFGRVNF